MRTKDEIIEALFSMLYTMATAGVLLDEEKEELSKLKIEWYAQNWDE